MNKKRKETWDRLKQQMGNKRSATDSNRKSKSSSAPHEIIVQRLASEPDNKQTFRHVQPREFVEFPYEELTLANLKKAWATHFSVPATTCDVLVSNTHRKDKVRAFCIYFFQNHTTVTQVIFYENFHESFQKRFTPAPLSPQRKFHLSWEEGLKMSEWELGCNLLFQLGCNLLFQGGGRCPNGQNFKKLLWYI